MIAETEQSNQQQETTDMRDTQMATEESMNTQLDQKIGMSRTQE